MLVVVCRAGDEQALAFSRRWPAGQVGLLTPEDLSTAGWRYGVPNVDRPTAVVEGRITSVDEISGVLTRLAVLGEGDLPHIRPVDRGYVASEMTAFLLSWLSSLPCPVLNPPMPPTLTSPCWRPERWARAASELGLSLSPLWSTTPAWAPREVGDVPDTASVVTAIGNRCLGNGDQSLVDRARALAAHVGVEVLAVRFDGTGDDALLMGASPWVDVGDPDVGEAILDRVSVGDADR